MLVIIEDKRRISSYDCFPISYEGIMINGIEEMEYDDHYQLLKKEGSLSFYDKNHDGTINIYFYQNDRLHHFLTAGKNRLLISNIEKSANIFDPLLRGDLRLENGIISTNSLNAYVNGLKYEGQPLAIGDEIEVPGTRIIYFKDFLQISSCHNINGLIPYQAKPMSILPPIVEETVPYLKMAELELEKIRGFHYEKPDRQPILRQLLSGILMSMTMIAIAVFAYSFSGSAFGIMYLIMPISVIMSSIIVPIATFYLDKNTEKKKYLKARDDYLEYLEAYRQRLDDKLASYQKELFKYQKGSLRLGYYKKRMDIDIPFCTDDAINKVYQEIRRNAYITDFPLDISTKCLQLGFYIKRCQQKETFEMLVSLLEKALGNDFLIAIYGLRDAIRSYGNLPYLYHCGRHIYDDEGELAKLNELRREKDIFVFAFKNISIEYANPHIHLFKILPIDEYLGQGVMLNGSYGSYEGQRFLINWQKGRPALFKGSLNFDSAIGFHEVAGKAPISENYQKEEGLLSIFAMKDGMPFGIDLHEKGNGPHGLIGGSTGSGKSELLISLLLGLCIRYSPAYLNIIIIDYKGGGIKESLSFAGKMVPHIVAHLSNLEDNAFERLIYAIRNECKRRQLLFQSLSAKLKRAIVNLDEYQANYQKAQFEKLAHFLILVDEFAQLKKEHPEYIKELVSISRIGRSLGLHLLLATQKPAGVIDEEIFSNSSFKLALRTYEERDSLDLIGKKDAKYLTRKGEFIMLHDDKLISAHSVFVKRPGRADDGRIIMLDERLCPFPEDLIDETENESICKEIINVCSNGHFSAKPLSYLPMARRKRHVKRGIGVSDDYIKDDYHEIRIDLDLHNLIIDTRKNAIGSLHNILNEEKIDYVYLTDQSVNGGYLADNILYQEHDDIVFLFESLLAGNQKRLVLLIKDLSAFLAYHEEYGNYLLKIMALANNVKVLALSANANIKYRYLMAFEEHYLIDDDSVMAVFGKRSAAKGKCFYFDGEVKPFIPYLVEEYRTLEQRAAPVLRRIPKIIRPVKADSSMLIGYDIKKRKALYGKGQIELFSYDKKLLERYEAAYGLKGTLCQYGKSYRHGRIALWLGGGFSSQRIFPLFTRDDPNGNEGYLFVENKVRKIRILDE